MVQESLFPPGPAAKPASVEEVDPGEVQEGVNIALNHLIQAAGVLHNANLAYTANKIEQIAHELDLRYFKGDMDSPKQFVPKDTAEPPRA